MRHRPHLLAGMIALATSVGAQGAPAEKVDISGKWSFSVQTDAGSGTPTVTFKQKGDSLSGRYSSQVLGERDFTGTIKNGKVDFGFTADVQGQQFVMTFSGAMDGADAMKGSIDLGGMAGGTFTAKRQKS